MSAFPSDARQAAFDVEDDEEAPVSAFPSDARQAAFDVEDDEDAVSAFPSDARQAAFDVEDDEDAVSAFPSDARQAAFDVEDDAAYRDEDAVPATPEPRATELPGEALDAGEPAPAFDYGEPLDDEIWDSPEDLAGRELAERYLLLRPLSRAPAARSYVAEDIHSGQPLVIRVLGPRHLAQGERAQQFRREARALLQLRHPRFVDVLDVATTPDHLSYYVSEYVAGENLAAVLEREAPFPWPRAVDILRQLLEGLAALHARGMAFGDLNPGSVLCISVGEERDVVKLIHAGVRPFVATSRDAYGQLSVAEGERPGTAEYMAPELALGADRGPTSDLYAAGALAYEMLCGRPPFLAASYADVVDLHLYEPPAPPGEVVPELEIPASIERVILRALAKEPRERFANAAAFLEALEQACASAPEPEPTPQPFDARLIAGDVRGAELYARAAVSQDQEDRFSETGDSAARWGEAPALVDEPGLHDAPRDAWGDEPAFRGDDERRALESEGAPRDADRLLDDDEPSFASERSQRGFVDDDERSDFASERSQRGFVDDERSDFASERSQRGFADDERSGFPGDGSQRGFVDDDERSGFPSDGSQRGFVDDDELEGFPSERSQRGFVDDERGFPSERSQGFEDDERSDLRASGRSAGSSTTSEASRSQTTSERSQAGFRLLERASRGDFSSESRSRRGRCSSRRRRAGRFPKRAIAAGFRRRRAKRLLE
ncbi:MAG: protein kinase [Nannocystaceae bacterium]